MYIYLFIFLSIFLFIYWLIIFSYIRKTWEGRQKRCTLRVLVKVIEVITMKPTRGTVLLHKPIFEACLMGDKVIINSAVKTHLFKLEVGQELWLYINPDDPQDFLYDSPYKDKLIFVDKIACVLPLIAILICFFMCLNLQYK